MNTPISFFRFSLAYLLYVDMPFSVLCINDKEGTLPLPLVQSLVGLDLI